MVAASVWSRITTEAMEEVSLSFISPPDFKIQLKAKVDGGGSVVTMVYKEILLPSALCSKLKSF